MSESCLFCKIVAGDVPSTKVAESEHTYAFRDIHPTAPTHVLVVPKQHIPTADHIRGEQAVVVAEMFETAQEAARIDGIAEHGYRLVFNVGRDANMEVPHLHMHVIGGRRLGWPPG